MSLTAHPQTYGPESAHTHQCADCRHRWTHEKPFTRHLSAEVGDALYDAQHVCPKCGTGPHLDMQDFTFERHVKQQQNIRAVDRQYRAHLDIQPDHIFGAMAREDIELFTAMLFAMLLEGAIRKGPHRATHSG